MVELRKEFSFILGIHHLLKRIAAASILILLFGSLLIGQAQDSCNETAGTITRERYGSFILGQDMFYSVYTPPCYDETDDDYPVLYLMHGSNEDDGHWVRLGLPEALDQQIANAEIPPLIVVLPFGNVIANRNRFDFVSWSNIFLEELMPHAEEKYRITTNPLRRGIGGISRGGFWAFSIGLNHPELFSVIGGHSGFFDLYHAPPEYNPLHLILDAPGIENMRFLIDRGKDDFAYEGLDIMGERMQERGVDYQYIVRPEGVHYNTYWRQHIREYVQFYAGDWAETDEVLPVETPTQSTSAPFVFATNTPNSPDVLATPTPVQPTIPTPTMIPTEAAASAEPEAYQLFVPVVSFPSLRTNIEMSELQKIMAGEQHNDLILDVPTLNALSAKGVTIHPETRIVEPDALFNMLWRNRDQFTILPFDQLQIRYRILWVDELHPLDQLETYPLIFTSESPNFQPHRLTRLTLSGVTALTRQTRTALDEYGVVWASEGIADYVQRSDFFHISNEVSFISGCPQTGGETLGGTSSMCSKLEHFELFELLDVDIVELSGNHNNDYGYEAYLDTLSYYESEGIAVVGGGRTVAEAREPLIINHAENRIALISCNIVGPYYALVNEDPQLLGGVRPGAADCHADWLQAELNRLSSAGYVVVMTVQHQEFEEYIPTQDQQFDFRQWANWGADAVLGTSAHKPQTFEFFSAEGGDISYLHYGMGNLYFDQPFWGNMRFFMNSLLVYNNELISVDLFPGIIDDNVRPRLMTADERLNFLHFMFVQQNGF